MKTIVLISCASKKLPHKAKASRIYISPLFQLSLRYAKWLNPNGIYILSAKHGVLGLNDEIAPYNHTLNKMSAARRREWAEKVLRQLGRRADLTSDRFIIIAGLHYRRYLIPHLRSCSVPLEKKPIGKQLRFLSRQLSK